MTHDQLILAAAAALFVAFLIGWLAAWLVLRSAGTPVVQVVQAPPRPADDARLSAAEVDASAAKEALDEARIEIEELRDYIERRLSRRPESDGQASSDGR